ncbi:MAG TPA: MFS transporter [Myxococcota bacterium]|nr:MFS transporter [Myxococcota bacterium]
MHAPRAERPTYANYVLGILFVAYVINFVDRQIVSILAQPIKDALGVSDSWLGFLGGPAFAIFYATLGIPIARVADLWVRRSVIAIGLALWSAMTALSGLSQTFTQLALARIGVGVGEAALSPPAHSLLADYFPVSKRATALGVYAMGIHIGVLVGLVLGGWLEELWGWRSAFMVVGLPGLALAGIVRATVREPVRGAQEAAPISGAPPPVSEVVRYLAARRSFCHLSLGIGLTAFAGYAFAFWAPQFLRRVHEMSSGELGTKVGIGLGTGGAIGSVLAGVIADRLGRRDVRWWMWVPAIACAGPLPFTLAFLLLPDPNSALLISFPGVVIAAMYQGPVFSTVQTLAPVRMRAVAAGVLMFVTNIIGLALGPQSIGWLNDYVFAAHGKEAVRYSLLVVLLVMGIWSATHFALAARALPADLARGER